MGAKLKSENMLGKVFSSKNYGDYVVTGFRDWSDIDIKFLKTGYIKNTNNRIIRARSIRDPYYPSVCGVGYCGEGVYSVSYHRNGSKIPTPAYNAWLGRLVDCYGKSRKSHLYTDVTFCKEWLNFQNFAEWFYKQVKIYGKAGVVDKDLLLLGSRMYSPETCVYIPRAVNVLFSGAVGNIGGTFLSPRHGKWVVQTTRGNTKGSYIGIYSSKQQADTAYYSAKLAHVKSVVLKYQEQISPALFYKMYHGTENYLNYYMFEKENNNAPQE